MVGARRFLTSERTPGEYIGYRVAVAATVLTSVGAAVSQEAIGIATGVVAVALIPIGYVLSYVRRQHRNVLLKAGLALALLAAFGGFLDGIRGAVTIDDTRAPLVALFLWVQVLHSFDVPRARDLTFSLASSVALIALAGSLAFSTGFLVFVLTYALLLAAALALGHDAELRRENPEALGTEIRRQGGEHALARSAARSIAAGLVMMLVATAVVFVFIPRLGAVRVAALPFSIAQRTPIADFTGGVVNPGQRGSDGTDTGSPTAFDPNAYYGYGQELNLSARGRLSDELVLRVRATRPSLYRAQAFDVYKDGRWTSSDTTLDEVRQIADAISVPGRPEDAANPGPELVQTFYVERSLPNLIFHAHQAKEVYVPSTRFVIDDFNSMRLPFILEDDTIYSVISRVPDADPETLRYTFDDRRLDPAMARYLQLPSSISERLRELSREITSPHAATVDKVLAVERWLRENKQYRLDISRDPPGVDPVEYFVFERREGFCEQIAATMAVMLRASGVPTRLVTGFGEGERNLFSGYWEVRNSDAHAWVEVFYPGHGWIPYDPTFGVPQSTAANTTFALEPLGQIFAGAIPLERIGRLPAAVWDGVETAWPVAAVVLALVAGASFVRRRIWGRRPRPPTERVAAAWVKVEQALSRQGAARASYETAHEFAHRALTPHRPGSAELRRFAAVFGRVRYGPAASEKDLASLEEGAERVSTALEASGRR